MKIAFTGTGYIAKIHARAARAFPDVELVAVANHRPESMASFAREFGIPRQHGTLRDLLQDGGIDAVIINTPNYLHAPEAIAALEAGVAVMVEKPMAMNGEEAAAMLAASRRSGAILMVAHCWRFDEEAIWLKEQLGRIGDVIRTKGYGVHVHWGPGGWFTQQRYAGGGAMADMGIHALDTARFLLGDPLPVSVYARLGTHYGDYDVDDTGLILVNWDNGTTSYIESGWWQPHADGPEASTQLYGKNGFASLYPTYLELPGAAQDELERIPSGYPFPREDHTPLQMYERQLGHFIQCVADGQIPVPGGREGVVNMRIVDAAYQSSREGRLVAVQTE